MSGRGITGCVVATLLVLLVAPGEPARGATVGAGSLGDGPPAPTSTIPVSAGSLGSSQESRCADCHVANFHLVPDPDHENEWEYSAHGRNDVGCEGCHGGDATTFDSFRAHREVLNSRNPASPVNRQNLPATCGACHVGPFAAFQKSRHSELFAAGDDRVPSCATCHGTVGAHLLSPRGLESSCAGCHGPGGAEPYIDRPAEARINLMSVEWTRDRLQQAKEIVERVVDATRKAELTALLRQVEVPLEEAIIAGHEFRFDPLSERLEVAQRRLSDLFDRIANISIE